MPDGRLSTGLRRDRDVALRTDGIDAAPDPVVGVLTRNPPRPAVAATSVLSAVSLPATGSIIKTQGTFLDAGPLDLARNDSGGAGRFLSEQPERSDYKGRSRDQTPHCDSDNDPECAVARCNGKTSHDRRETEPPDQPPGDDEPLVPVPVSGNPDFDCEVDDTGNQNCDPADSTVLTNKSGDEQPEEDEQARHERVEPAMAGAATHLVEIGSLSACLNPGQVPLRRRVYQGTFPERRPSDSDLAG
jgi:hypothetical protein